ncbi:hypothetical protein FRC01_007171 [Tulasnella sp. 417]|nr:hypothetical protein FRC01_007171 [Tulasnella sp. 417]
MAFRKLRRHETPQRLETPKPHGITSRIPFLPDEILLLIAELSDEQAQLHMTQTCHRLQRLVEPIFYRHIRVRRGHGLSGYRLHRTLAARPDLLPVIRSYHGPLIHKANNSEIITSSEPSRGKALWRKISTNTRKWLVNDLDSFERANIIFSGAVNIRVLHCTDAITEDGARILGALAIPLESTTTTNIQSLVLRIGPNSPQLAPILRTQLKLRHLELQLESYVPMRLEKDDLPELESLKAELRYAAEIVPGRPVKKIELLNDWTPDKDSLRQLALSKCRITEFTANIGFPHQDLRDFAIPLAPARYLPPPNNPGLPIHLSPQADWPGLPEAVAHL